MKKLGFFLTSERVSRGLANVESNPEVNWFDCFAPKNSFHREKWFSSSNVESIYVENDEIIQFFDFVRNRRQKIRRKIEIFQWFLTPPSFAVVLIKIRDFDFLSSLIFVFDNFLKKNFRRNWKQSSPIDENEKTKNFSFTFGEATRSQIKKSVSARSFDQFDEIRSRNRFSRCDGKIFVVRWSIRCGTRRSSIENAIRRRRRF